MASETKSPFNVNKASTIKTWLGIAAVVIAGCLAFLSLWGSKEFVPTNAGDKMCMDIEKNKMDIIELSHKTDLAIQSTTRDISEMKGDFREQKAQIDDMDDKLDLILRKVQ